MNLAGGDRTGPGDRGKENGDGVRTRDLKSLYNEECPEDGDEFKKGEGLEKCQASGDMGSKPLPAFKSSMMKYNGDPFFAAKCRCLCTDNSNAALANRDAVSSRWLARPFVFLSAPKLETVPRCT